MWHNIFDEITKYATDELNLELSHEKCGQNQYGSKNWYMAFEVDIVNYNHRLYDNQNWSTASSDRSKVDKLWAKLPTIEKDSGIGIEWHIFHIHKPKYSMEVTINTEKGDAEPWDFDIYPSVSASWGWTPQAAHAPNSINYRKI